MVMTFRPGKKRCVLVQRGGRGRAGSVADAARAGCARWGAHRRQLGPRTLKLHPKLLLSFPAFFLADIIPFVMIQIDFLQALNF